MILIDADFIRETVEGDEQFTDTQVRAIRALDDTDLEDLVEGYLGDPFWREVHAAIGHAITEGLSA